MSDTAESDTDTHTAKILAMPRWTVLVKKPGANAWEGLIENSFTMGWSPDRSRVFPSGEFYSILGTHQVDGKEDADAQGAHYREKYPDWTVEVFDALSDDCPVEFDWDRWAIDMMAGSRAKFENRNPKFVAKDL